MNAGLQNDQLQRLNCCLLYRTAQRILKDIPLGIEIYRKYAQSSHKSKDKAAIDDDAADDEGMSRCLKGTRQPAAG